jgi:hypothetical protein
VTPDCPLPVRPYLGVLFPEPTPDLVELRAFQAGRRDDAVTRLFAAPEDLETIERFILDGLHRRRDLYAGLAARRDPTSGALGNCTTLAVVWADIDFKQIPEVEARQRLAAFPLAPSMTIHSGGGLHPYWALSDPLEVHAHEGPLRSILRRLALRFGGDLSAAEPARVLRIPGTMNFKYQPARRVLLEADPLPGRRILLNDLDQFLPPEASASGPGERFRAPAEPVGPGERNQFLYRLARSLKSRGLSRQAILAAAWVSNHDLCVPPHDDDEVVRVVDHAWSQPDRPWTLLPERIPGGSQNTVLMGLATRLRRWGLEAPEIASALGEINRRRCSPALSDREIRDIAASCGAAHKERLAPSPDVSGKAAGSGGVPEMSEEGANLSRDGVGRTSDISGTPGWRRRPRVITVHVRQAIVPESRAAQEQGPGAR